MSSSVFEKGTGVCGAVTISIGARKAPKACLATSADTSVATERLATELLQRIARAA